MAAVLVLSVSIVSYESLSLFLLSLITPRIIAIVDGTYSFIHKSSNFRALRETYGVHKSRHLVKPHLKVAPDGYILGIQGPYLCDSRNNVAAILQNEFEIDAERMRDNEEEFQIEMLRNEREIPKRDKLSTLGGTSITTEEAEEEEEIEPIECYYCTCNSGARTIGTCAHTASVIWYIGYTRHNEDVHYPFLRLIQTVNDAANKTQ
ncbi:hypothetical protein FQA39_LY16311 [Lamprigera yunnana]|nr:hypothetical protein FQA39_LY16311 [Lamprigera yunnana]